MISDHRISLEPGFVLHRKPYRDTSLLLEAFTAEHGRIGLVARGVRRRRGGQQGLLQPFQPLLLSWSGRGDLRTLTGVESTGPGLPLSGAALAAGFYVNEVLLRLVQRHDPQPELYEVYVRVMAALVVEADLEWPLRLFERDLLQVLGYGLLLTEEAETDRPIQPSGSYWYHLERGPAGEALPGSVPVAGTTLLALASGRMPGPRERGEAKRLMRSALRLYLGDKPLGSRRLFRQLSGGGPNTE